MDKTRRAKQFMPFDALTGFREALREKERLVENEKETLKEDEIFICDISDLQV